MTMNAKPTKPTVLIVDDDAQERHSLAEMIAGLNYESVTAEDGLDALEKLKTTSADVIVTDLMMPRMDGLELLKTLIDRGDLTPAIVLTAFGDINYAISIVHDLKAFWFLEKPATEAVVTSLLERAVYQRSLVKETERLQRQLSHQGYLGDLFGTSVAMRKVFSLIHQVAPSSAPVLITGESGTGKERAAAAIHKLSPRADRPFVAINCAALPSTLIESELFGHEKGSFTGALGRHAGCFEQAHHGTLFLDEIGEMPLPMQAKLLRVLEESKIRRLGGSAEIPVDVRIIAATNRAVKDALDSKVLREDLYYRLNVFHIDLPPLRQRKDDIPGLAEAILRELNRKNDSRVTALHASTLERLLAHSWPGNVRELRNVLERAVISAGEGILLPAHLPPTLEISQTQRLQSTDPVSPQDANVVTMRTGKPLSEVEKQYILATLRLTGNNKTRAAEILGISIRTLQNRLAEFARQDSGEETNQTVGARA
jgi:DNA-binding NtrC family response regulator